MCRLGRALRSGDEDEGRGEERGGGAVRRKHGDGIVRALRLPTLP